MLDNLSPINISPAVTGDALIPAVDERIRKHPTSFFGSETGPNGSPGSGIIHWVSAKVTVGKSKVCWLSFSLVCRLDRKISHNVSLHETTVNLYIPILVCTVLPRGVQ